MVQGDRDRATGLGLRYRTLGQVIARTTASNCGGTFRASTHVDPIEAKVYPRYIVITASLYTEPLFYDPLKSVTVELRFQLFSGFHSVDDLLGAQRTVLSFGEC